jgi:hypothetical protein
LGSRIWFTPSWVVALADTIIHFASTYPLYLRAAERDPAAATERILNRIFGLAKDPLRGDSSCGPASQRQRMLAVESVGLISCAAVVSHDIRRAGAAERRDLV